MRKFIIIAASFVALAVPTAAMADAPTGGLIFKDGSGAQVDNASSIGQQSSQIKQNGQFVSGQQTTYPGQRAELVQLSLGH